MAGSAASGSNTEGANGYHFASMKCINRGGTSTKRCLSSDPGRFEKGVQGHLIHKKMQPPRTIP